MKNLNNFFKSLFLFIIIVALVLLLFFLYALKPSANIQLIAPEKVIVNSIIFKESDGNHLYASKNRMALSTTDRPFLHFPGLYYKNNIRVASEYSIDGKTIYSECNSFFNSPRCFSELYFLRSGLKCTTCTNL